MKILIVEDEPVSQEKLKLIVSAFGDCDCAESGAKALELFQAAAKQPAGYGLVLLDILLPDMKGNELLAKMRATERESGGSSPAKIVMVTGCLAKDTVVDCKTHGCDDYIIKPFHKDVVTKKLCALGLAVKE